MDKSSDSFVTLVYNPTEQLNLLIDQAIIRVVRTRGWDVSSDDIFAIVAPIVYGVPSLAEMVKTRVNSILAYRQQLEHLLALPKVEQRSPEWYAMRKTMTTASDLAQALGQGKFGTQKDFIVKKCGYKEDAAFQWMLPPLRWGVKYEPVATDIYRLKHGGVQLHEFGLIQHPTRAYFGASPDGITDLGIMLEIKCPYRRAITGTNIPMQYYYQIQGQLDVCGLEECDYMEVEFKEYRDWEAFVADVHSMDATRTADFKEKGVLLEYKVRDQEIPLFHYGPICLPSDETWAWVEAEEERLHADPAVEWVNKVYWRVQTFSVQRVYRDVAFIEQAYNGLESVWRKIQAYKEDKELYDRDMQAPLPVESEEGGAPKKKGRGGGGSAKTTMALATPKFSKSAAEEECMIRL